MKQLVRVLLIEDDEDDVLLAREYLAESAIFKFEVQWESGAESAMKLMKKGEHDIFLIDYRLDSHTGLDIIRFAQENGVIKPCILLTGQGDEKVDLDAMRYGAADYLVKAELNASILERSIRYALSQAKVISELDQKEKRYRSLFERSVDPIFLANEELQLIDVNGAFLSFFQYSKEEALQLNITDIFQEETAYQLLLDALKASEQIRDYEAALVNNRGENRSCLINCVFIADMRSDFCCYQGIIHDQTMRKRAEKDMLIAERLSMTGKIARTIAHEVRNPLTNLNLALEQLRDEIPKDNDAVDLYTNIIERNANRIEQLIGEMLSSSKPRELNLELVSVSEIVEETLSLTIDRLNLNRMKIIRSFKDELPRILLDRESIKIALLNILINAVEAMEPERGILQVGIDKQDKTVVIVITDNGKGIAAEEIEKLFDPFYTAKQGGMGLGLTSTKNILNSHNATVEVTSVLSEGTTFTIYFTLADS